MPATFVSARSAFLEFAVPVLSGRAGSRAAATLGMPFASTLQAEGRHVDIAARIDAVLLSADRWMESLRQLDVPDRPPRKVESALQSLASGSLESVDLMIEATELFMRELHRSMSSSPSATKNVGDGQRDNLHQLCQDVGGIPGDLMHGNLAAGSAVLPPGQFELFAVKEWRNPVVHEGVSGPIAVRTVLTAWLYVLDRHWRELRSRTEALICRPFARGQPSRFAAIRQDFLQPLAAVGRTAELGRLNDWRSETAAAATSEDNYSRIPRQNAGKCVVVTGYEGAGKTRLLTMWLDQLADRDALGREADAVRRVAPWLPRALVWSARSGEGVRQLLPSLRAQANTVLLIPIAVDPPGAACLAGAGPVPAEEVWTPERAKQEMITLCEAVVREVGSCVVLIDGIDELQGQSGSRAVDEFVGLLPQQPPPGTLFILGCRSATQALKKVRHRRIIEELEVGPLERQDVEAILAPLGAAAAARLDDVVAETSGHAMHVVAARQVLGGPDAAAADLSNLDEEFVRLKIDEFSSATIDPGRPDPLPELLRFMSLIGQFVDPSMDDVESWLKRRPCGYDVQRVREWIDRHGETIRLYRTGDVERLRMPWKLVLKRARDEAGRVGREAVMRELALWVVEEVRDGDGVHEDTAFAVGQVFRSAPERFQQRLLDVLDAAARLRPWPDVEFPSDAMRQIWRVVEGWSADDKLDQIRIQGKGLELARLLAEATRDAGVMYWLAMALQRTGENERCDEAKCLLDELAQGDADTPWALANFGLALRRLDVSPQDAGCIYLREFIDIEAEGSPVGAAHVAAQLMAGCWTDGSTGDTASTQLVTNINRLTSWANSENEEVGKLARALLASTFPFPEIFSHNIRSLIESKPPPAKTADTHPLTDYFKALLGSSESNAVAGSAVKRLGGAGRFEVARPEVDWLRRLDRAASGQARVTFFEELHEYIANGPYSVVRPLVGGWIMRISKLDEAEGKIAYRALSEALAIRGRSECWAARLALQTCPPESPVLAGLRPLAERWQESVLPWWRVSIAAAYLLEADADAYLAMWQEIQQSLRVDCVPWMGLPTFAGLACLQGDVDLATAVLEQHTRVEPGLLESIAIQEELRAAVALLIDDLPKAREHFTRYLTEVAACPPTVEDGQPAPRLAPCRDANGKFALELRRDLTTTEVQAVWLQALEAVH
jgi:hypothetical protein